jgi:hypothetical protein
MSIYAIGGYFLDSLELLEVNERITALLGCYNSSWKFPLIFVVYK